MSTTFAKTLSANDVGATGSHQAGILVPKTDKQLMSFFPALDPDKLNPDAWVTCIDDSGRRWKVRYVYYNNKFHTELGTRNEYRLTCLTKFFQSAGARTGDNLMLTTTNEPLKYRISIVRTPSRVADETPGLIVLQGWRRIH